jgi:hypothetical protein
MLTIDWGDLLLSRAERREIEKRVANVNPDLGSVVSLRRCREGFEARLQVPTQEQSTQIRLHDENVGMAVERLTTLLEIVACARRELQH